jgi:hypothetical protein
VYTQHNPCPIFFFFLYNHIKFFCYKLNVLGVHNQILCSCCILYYEPYIIHCTCAAPEPGHHVISARAARKIMRAQIFMIDKTTGSKQLFATSYLHPHPYHSVEINLYFVPCLRQKERKRPPTAIRAQRLKILDRWILRRSVKRVQCLQYNSCCIPL